MSTQANKAQFHRTIEELFNQGNLAVADELFAPDLINHDGPPGRLALDRGRRSEPGEWADTCWSGHDHVEGYQEYDTDS